LWTYIRWSAIRSASEAALLAECQRGAVEHLPEVGAALFEERAELVAAHPEHVGAVAEEGAQLAAEARQQDVAGGVAEGVVVVLEAVEVEQRAARRRARGSARVGCRGRSARR
jgi:hypothetical protein